jgi:hypothetical protein
VGARGPDGEYPPESINGRVLARLRAFAERLKGTKTANREANEES